MVGTRGEIQAPARRTRAVGRLPALSALLAAAGLHAGPAEGPATRPFMDTRLGISVQVPARFQLGRGAPGKVYRFADPERGETLRLGAWPGDLIPAQPDKAFDDRVVAQVVARELGPGSVWTASSSREGPCYRLTFRFDEAGDPRTFAWVQVLIAERRGAILIHESPRETSRIEQALGAPPALALREPSPEPGPSRHWPYWSVVILAVSAIVASLLLASLWKSIARFFRIRRFARARPAALAVLTACFLVAALLAWLGREPGPARAGRLRGLGIAYLVSAVVVSVAGRRLDRRRLGRLRSASERPPWVDSFGPPRG